MILRNKPRIKFVEEYWFNYNPSLTHFMSALSVLFPHGERYFLKTMNHYRGMLSNDLLEELNTFVKQEIAHGYVHEELNSKFSNSKLLKEMENETKTIIDTATKYLTPMQKLTVTACLEHITAIMGEQLIARNDLTDKMYGDPREIWKNYHAVEEVEHAHVSYDIYYAVGGTYLLRTGLLIPVTAILIGVILRNWIKIMHNDKKYGYDGIFYAVKTLIGKNGFITGLIPSYFEWFKPDFHPKLKSEYGV